MDYSKIKVAYFSAEIGISNEIKTYSGGLGILAGDIIKSMADLEFDFCAVTLLYKFGFFKQKIEDNKQIELEDKWDYEKYLKDTEKSVVVNIKGELIKIKIWRYDYVGISGFKVPIFFLDTHLEENPDWAKDLTNRLYQGDRLAQEIILGIGGLRALNELGINPKKYHMNEGHSAFLTLELYKLNGYNLGWDDKYTREKCVFTTHTPIPAGHDKFEYEKVYEYLKGEKDIIPFHIKKAAGEDLLNTTKLAMYFSSYINAVSKKHRDVTQKMFPNFEIDFITNGVHLKSWIAKDFQNLYDIYFSGWDYDNSKLKEAFRIPSSNLYLTKMKVKKDLINFLNSNSLINKGDFKENVLTIGFARRFIQYKDAELIFSDLDRLKKLGKKIQIIFAGKSHAKDTLGKEIITRILENAEQLKDFVKIGFIENYNIEIAKKLVSGCDIWLNTPIPPNEASGTSGMKAVANGTLHISRLDGWAIEAYEMCGGGFPIDDVNSLYDSLEFKLIPMYYNKNKIGWLDEMKYSIGISASYFNTHRVAKEYIKKAYNLDF